METKANYSHKYALNMLHVFYIITVNHIYPFIENTEFISIFGIIFYFLPIVFLVQNYISQIAYPLKFHSFRIYLYHLLHVVMFTYMQFYFYIDIVRRVRVYMFVCFLQNGNSIFIFL